MASPGRCLIGTYSEDSGEIMRKISILAVAAASFALSPLAMAQETDAPAPTEEPAPTAEPAPEPTADRKSVGEGKSVSVRVDLGGSRIIKKKKSKYEYTSLVIILNLQ